MKNEKKISYLFRLKHFSRYVKNHLNNVDFLINEYKKIYKQGIPETITILPYFPYEIDFLPFKKKKMNDDNILVSNVIKFYVLKPKDKTLDGHYGKVYVIENDNTIMHLVGFEILDEETGMFSRNPIIDYFRRML